VVVLVYNMVEADWKQTYVVDVFASDGGSHALALGSTLDDPLVLELSLLLDKIPLCGIVVAVVKLAVLDGTKLGLVLLGQDLTISDGLDSAVVVVLVNLLVYSSVDLLVDVGLNGLVGDSRSNSLVDCGVMLTRALGEVSESCLDLVHFVVCSV
jgi:hypothetical protein